MVRSDADTPQTPFDLGWLTASDDAVVEALSDWPRARFRSIKGERPPWGVRRHLTVLAVAWTLPVSATALGMWGTGDISPGPIAGAILIVWAAAHLAAVGAFALRTRRSLAAAADAAVLERARVSLVAAENGFRAEPMTRPEPSLVVRRWAADPRAALRVAAPGIDVAELFSGGVRGHRWHTLSLTLPAPLPHLFLDATERDGGRFPLRPRRAERVAVSSWFEHRFRVFAPAGYAADALYVLTPDLMERLGDAASTFSVEIASNRAVFFAGGGLDLRTVSGWRRVERILSEVAPVLSRRAARYRDERVEGQDGSAALDAIRASFTRDASPATGDIRTPMVAERGRRLRSLAGWRLTLPLLPRGARVVLTIVVHSAPLVVTGVALLAGLAGALR